MIEGYRETYVASGHVVGWYALRCVGEESCKKLWTELDFNHQCECRDS